LHSLLINFYEWNFSVRKNDQNSEINQPRRRGQIFSSLTSITLIGALLGCSNVTSNQYEATALVTLTWKVEYSLNRTTDKNPRVELFASTSLVNRNGIKPEGAVTGPDERGLWWPALPPKPTLDELEKLEKNDEKPSNPELLREVKYEITYRDHDQKVTLPTNYEVYRQVAKTYPTQTPLNLTLGVNDASVEKAEPQ